MRKALGFSSPKNKQAANSYLGIPIKRDAADKNFLKYFIQKLADVDVLVYEFVEHHNLKRKTVWEGMFLRPNAIAIKRQQKALKREIFTLAHEFAHYLLNLEDIDDDPLRKSQADVEKWCNDFAFYFIVGEERKNLLELLKGDPSISNKKVLELSNQLHISRLAIYTHFVAHGEIQENLYEKLCSDLHQAEESELKQRGLTEKAKDKKLGGRAPKPIYPPP